MRLFISMFALAFLTACASVPSASSDRRAYAATPGGDFVHPDQITATTTDVVYAVAQDGYTAQVMATFRWRNVNNSITTQCANAFLKPEGTTVGYQTSCSVTFYASHAVLEVRSRERRDNPAFDMTTSQFVCEGRMPNVWRRDLGAGFVLRGRSTTSDGQWEEVSCSSHGFIDPFTRR